MPYLHSYFKILSAICIDTIIKSIQVSWKINLNEWNAADHYPANRLYDFHAKTLSSNTKGAKIVNEETVASVSSFFASLGSPFSSLREINS